MNVVIKVKLNILPTIKSHCFYLTIVRMQEITNKCADTFHRKLVMQLIGYRPILAEYMCISDASSRPNRLSHALHTCAIC